jgi:hypothetical protein
MAEGFSDELIKNILATTESIDALDSEYEAKEDKLLADFRATLEPLLSERQAALDKIDGFWANVLTNGRSPTKKLLNGTTDPKVMRAVKSFRVQTTSADDKITRKIILELRPNIFVESQLLYREIEMGAVDSDATVKASGVVWKAGTEKSRTDSILRFFDASSGAPEDWQADVLDAFDLVFQNPFEYNQA